jgi:hypothetical protein
MSKGTKKQTSGLSPEVQDKKALTKVLSVAKQFATAKDAVADNKDVILKLREEFGVKKGSAGRKLNIEGNLITWETFVKEYFHITTQWMDMLLGVKTRKSETDETKPDNEKPLYKKGFAAGRESSANNDVEAEIREGVNKKYEREIADLKSKQQRVATTEANHRRMLIKLLAEIEKVGDKVPVALSQLAKKMQADLEKKPSVVAMEATLAEADVESTKAKIEDKSESNGAGYLVARLEKSETDFGLFPERESAPYTNAKALAIGTKAKMEAERRDRCAMKKPEQSQAAQAGS